MSPRASLDRRRFLVRGLQAGGLLLAGSALAACGDDDSGSEPAGATGPSGKNFGTLDYRLAWLKNVEFAGSWIADTNGYFVQEGFSGVNFIGGGPSATPQETDVVTGKAFVALSSPDRTGSAIKQGAKLKIVGAQFQKNPFAIMSMADKPILTPQDMIGKKIGVGAANEAVWQAFLKANKIDEGKITKVPVQFDPLPLTTGTVDGWMCYITNEPTNLRMKGFQVHTFMLSDFAYPLVGETYVVTQANLEKHRDKIKALLRADIRGWKDSLKDPVAGARLAVDKYGKELGLSLEEQTIESREQNKLVSTEETIANGLFTMSPALIEANLTALSFAGLDIKGADLFDMTLLDEIYREDPALKAGVTPAT